MSVCMTCIKKTSQRVEFIMSECLGFFDLSIESTKTKYIKLNTKTQNIFCRLNENLATFLYTLTGATRKQKEKKVFSFKVYTKVELLKKKISVSI